MATRHTKERLFEVMMKVDKTFKAKLTEEIGKTSFPKGVYDDIKVLLGNRDALGDNDIQQIATSHNVDPNIVIQTLDYIKKEREEQKPEIPSNSAEAEEVNDFFKFLAKNPQKGSVATVEYASSLDRNLAKPKTNPMVGRFIKLTKYGFEWERTYAKEVEKVNPEWELQARKGDYSKMEGGYGNVMERDARGDEVLPIVPRNPKSIILVLDENGNVADKIKSKELQEKYGEYFVPSFFTPKESGSGVDFRPLKLYAINRIAAGGKEWINPKMKPPFDKYREYFKDIDTSLTEDEEMQANTEDEFFPITTPVGSDDDKMFIKVVNQGIDSHLQGFTKSKFSVQDQTLGKRRVLNFHKSELPILIRRLRELGTDEAEQWANDIENYDDNINEMVTESREGFERKVGFWIYSKDGDFLGETDPMPEEAEWFETKDEVLSSPEGQKFLTDNNLTPEQIGRIKRERLYFMNGNPLSFEYYSPSQSQELFDDKTNTWYNRSGQQMRDPSEYERYSDGTNQWGEYYDEDYQ